MSSTPVATELQAWNHELEYSQHEPVSEHSSSNIGNVTDTPSGEMVIQELAPADGGRAAWGMLAAAFVFEALLWGKQPYLLS